jgi:hypothetical protein
VLLGLLVDRRHQIVSQRQETLCRIHDRLMSLAPGGSHHLTVKRITAELARIRPVDQRLTETLDAHGTTLRAISGIAEVGAATILAIVGHVSRFPTPAAFATFNGTAPIAASSGDKTRHRLHRGGQRAQPGSAYCRQDPVVNRGGHPRVSGEPGAVHGASVAPATPTSSVGLSEPSAHECRPMDARSAAVCGAPVTATAVLRTRDGESGLRLGCAGSRCRWPRQWTARTRPNSPDLSRPPHRRASAGRVDGGPILVIVRGGHTVQPCRRWRSCRPRRATRNRLRWGRAVARHLLHEPRRGTPVGRTWSG